MDLRRLRQWQCDEDHQAVDRLELPGGDRVLSSSTYLTSGLWLLIGKGAIHAGSCRGASQGRR